MLSIYNTSTRKKEQFQPLIPGKVSLYVCGMTVYDDCHIGHSRLFVVFDMITRYLRFVGYEVNYVRNITDIDDKIIQRALENNESITQLVTRYIKATAEDENALNVLPPTIQPRATQHINDIIRLISLLIDKGYAYSTASGDVYYAVNRFATYGQFAQQSLDKLLQGARVDILEDKENPLDFALWKAAKPHEPNWESPWGKGRPGWHIECSAMAATCLGPTIDLHGGGQDLIFPHHQNEIAQSEAAFGCSFAKTWIHIGYVQVNAQKMSKSLNNFSTIRTVLMHYDAEVLRYFILASHYRSFINYSTENLESAKAGLYRLYTCLRDLPLPDLVTNSTEKTSQNSNLTDFQLLKGQKRIYLNRFMNAMNDDFNTPVALAVLFDIVRAINKAKDEKSLTKALKLGILLKQLGNLLGILQKTAADFLQADFSEVNTAEINELINRRNQARADKNWQQADQIREELLEKGIIIEDTPKGSIIRKSSCT